MDLPTRQAVDITHSIEYAYEWSNTRDMLYLHNDDDETLIVFPLTGEYCYMIRMDGKPPENDE